MVALGLLTIPVLIAINAYFVAVEFAIVALRKTRVEEMTRAGIRGAKSIEAVQNNLDRSIAAAQLGITLASIALGAVGESVLAKLLEPAFSFVPENWEPITRHSIAAMLAIAIITFMHVIIGEQVPKMMAIQSADRVALWTARPLLLFAKSTAPILRLMNAAGNLVLRRMGYHVGDSHQTVHSVDELRMIIEDTQEAGLLQSDQAIFVNNVFQLTDKKVRDCMVPRDKMDALELRTKPNKVLEFVRKCAHTRIPVYDETPDQIVGILNTKNLFYFHTLGHAVVLDDVIYPAQFIDADESIATALQLFRKARRPMFIVRDSQAQILGMITLEDVIEEIIGDLEDEHDDATRKR